MTCRHSSLPIDPPAPVTSTVLPVTLAPKSSGWGATGAVISGSGSIALQLTSAGDEWVQGFSEIYEEIKSVGLKTSDSSQWAALSGCYLTTSREESRECLGAVKAVMNPGVEGRVEELG